MENVKILFHKMSDIYEEKRTINKLMEASFFISCIIKDKIMFYQLIDNPYTFESSFSFEESAFTELAK